MLTSYLFFRALKFHRSAAEIAQQFAKRGRVGVIRMVEIWGRLGVQEWGVNEMEGKGRKE